MACLEAKQLMACLEAKQLMTCPQLPSESGGKMNRRSKVNLSLYNEN